jgi:hypothetical protein
MMDGRIEQRQINRLEAIGHWLELYGESIYGTAGGPFKPTRWLASTCKGNLIYLHLFMMPKEDLRLPIIAGRRITRVHMLHGASLPYRITGGQIVITLPREPVNENDVVLVMDLNGPADEVVPLDVPDSLFKGPEQVDVKLTTPPGPAYPGHGEQSLFDKVRGVADYHDENWLGFERVNCEAVIDLHMVKPVKKVTVGCLQVQDAWIFLPRAIEVSISDDGKVFQSIGKIETGELQPTDAASTEDFEVPCTQALARFVKVCVFNTGLCPPWHKGAGGKAWLFVDEITVN